MSDNIKVAIKVRPLIKREIDEKLEIQWAINENSIVPLNPEQKKRGEGGYSFDHIFDTTQTNMDLFELVAKPIIDEALNGVNGTIFAYGQTSSGKTYTMMGCRDNAGVIPLAINYIFESIKRSYNREYLLRVSYLEIYNERMSDLLDPGKSDLKITEDPKSGQAVVRCKEEVINTAEKVLIIMKKGDRNRRTGVTNMNERSSRSHTIFRLIIESRESNGDSNVAVNVSQLNLVDLAGSERARQTGATGERFHEGVQINLSLSKLGLVIKQLSECQEYINFRDSKLTRILESSLGGNAMTAIICAITTAALEETQCTLAFASRAKRIKNKPQVNEVLSDQALLRRYAKQMSKLEEELEEAKSADVAEMASKLEEKERALELLAERHERLKKAIVGGCSASQGVESVPKTDMRRRTWAGSEKFQSKTLLLPTIDELDSSNGSHTPQIVNEKSRVYLRQSILQSLDDIVTQNFHTKITDFELELMESERASCQSRLSSDSNLNDEECFYITKRPQNSAKFQDDPVVFESSDDSSETISGRKTPESTSMDQQVSPDTPKPVLRSRLAFLVEQFNGLSTDHRNLEEFTKKESQLICDDRIADLMTEHRKLLAASEEKCQLFGEKCSNLEIRLTELEEQLAESAELEKQLVDLATSMQTLQSEKKNLIEEVKRLKSSKPVNHDESQIATDPSDYSSIFSNVTHSEDINISDIDGDSVLIDDSQNFQDLEMSDNSIVHFLVKKFDESDNKDTGLSNSAYREFIKQIGEKSNDEVVTVIQRLINGKVSLEDDNSKLQAMLQLKARETEEIKNAVREFKSGMEKLQETVQQLTNENTELTSKLSAEKEQAKEFQSVIEQLKLTSNNTIVDEKSNPLENNSEMVSSSAEKELRELLTQAKKDIASLTAENEELSSSLMSNIEEMDRLKISSSPSLETEHNCVYRDLSINLSERNKFLEAENIELSNNLMEKIEDYDTVKSKLENLTLKLISPNATLTESSKLIEISINHTNVCNEIEADREKTVDDLWRLSTGDDNRHIQPLLSLVTDKSIRKSSTSEDTLGNLLENSLLANQSTLCDNQKQNDENPVMPDEPVNHINLPNNTEFGPLKNTRCTQCTHLAELNANRKLLKLEVKGLNKKLGEFQKTFDRECADSKLLTTKANEEINLSVFGDITLDTNGTMIFEEDTDNLNVSFVERKIQALYQELETLRDKHEKLSDRYKEKCDEIEKFQDACSRETTPTPTIFTDSPSRNKRSDCKLDKIQIEIEKLRMDYKQSRENIAAVSGVIRKIVNEKNIKETKASSNPIIITDNDDNIIVTLKNDVACLNEEIMHCNEAEQKFENEKSFLQAEVEHLRAGTADNDNSVEEIASEELNDVRATEENIIFNLNEEVVRLNEKIIQCNVVKEELESAKSILQAEVEFLKAEKANDYSVIKKKEEEDSFVDSSDLKSVENDTSIDKMTILNLNNEVARLNEEIIRLNVANDELERMLNAWQDAKSEEDTESEEKAKKDAANALTAQERIRVLETDVIHLNAKIDASDIKNQQLETVKSSLDVEIATLRAEVNDQRIRITALLESLENLETVNSSLILNFESVTSEKNELSKKCDILVAESVKKCSKNEESSKIDENNSIHLLKSELESARECITREINSLKTPNEKTTASDNDNFMDTSISQLFGIFVQTIMSKEQQIIKALSDRYESEKRKLEEQNRQSCDGEKRANVWAKELEEEIEQTQRDLARQEASTVKLNKEISKLENLLMESTHENQVLNEKMKVLELDFNTLQGELSKQQHSSISSSSVCLDSSQDRERLVQEARELELSAKLRLLEKQSKEKLEESSKKLEYYQSKNHELTNTLEGLEANERQLKSIADMKINELAKANSTVERLRGELEHLTNNHNQLSQQHNETTRQIDEITGILKTKCDKLSEYKTKLETISPEYEYLKDQSVERQLRIEKYKSEIERMSKASEEEISSLKRRLNSQEEIISADYRKRLEDLTNRNIVFESEIKELRINCKELEQANEKLSKTMRNNSTSKIRAEEEMEDLRDENRTLKRNLDGAGNRITELQEAKTNILTELNDIRSKYDRLFNELNVCKSLHTASVSGTTELREKYDSLLEETNRIALAHEASKLTIIQLEKNLEISSKEIDELKTTNKNLDEEMDDMVGKIRELEKDNAELDDKLYRIETENKNGETIDRLKAEIEILRSTVETSKQTLERLRNENSELKSKYGGHLDRPGDSHVKSCDSSRSVSPALEAIRIDNRRRSSRTELYNLKRPLEMVDTNQRDLPYGECRCAVLQDEIGKLERELVTKNGEIAALEIRIQSENFPHMKRCKELDELLASWKRRCKALEFEIQKNRDFKDKEFSSECNKCRHWRANKCDQSTQCLPESARICLNGMSSGIIGDHIKMEKLEKDKDTLKNLCRRRQTVIFELEKKVKQLEGKLKKDSIENEKPTDRTMNLSQ